MDRSCAYIFDIVKTSLFPNMITRLNHRKTNDDPLYKYITTHINTVWWLV